MNTVENIVMPKRKTKKAIKKYKKRAIPAALKSAVWLFYNKRNFEAKCHVTWCQSTINVFNYEAGHDIPESKGGSTTLENLRPICPGCNKSMGNIYSISEFSRIFSQQKKNNRSWFRIFSCYTRLYRSQIQPCDDS